MSKLDDMDEMFNLLPIEVRLEMTETARVRACRTVLRLEDEILAANDEDRTVMPEVAARIRATRMMMDYMLEDTIPWDEREENQ